MPFGKSNTAVREKLVLQVGRPVTIALEYSSGKLVSSQYDGGKDQMYYTLTDGRCWYADLAAAEMIEQLDLVAREPFTVCKLGTGRFEVQRAGHFPTEPISNADTRHRVNDSAEFIEPAAKPPQRTATRVGVRAAVGNSDRQREEPTADNSPSEVTTAAPATKLEHALKTAILASANAEKYATEIGYTVRFTPDAIKCMAISVLIGMEQGGRR